MGSRLQSRLLWAPTALAAVFAAASASAQFPPIGDDIIPSLGSFRIYVNPAFRPLFGGYPGYNGVTFRLQSPTMFDPATRIGRSNPHPHGSLPDIGGTPVGTLGVIVRDSDFTVLPAGFQGPPGTREVHTHVVNFVLNDLTAFGARVRAGAAAPGQPRSIGEVESLNTLGIGNPAGDFPAESFFDIFVDVDLPMAGGLSAAPMLYNQSALLVVRQPLNAFPPTIIYVHGNSSAVPIYFRNANPPQWNANDQLGYLVLAGHGAGFSQSQQGQFDQFMQTVHEMQVPNSTCQAGPLTPTYRVEQIPDGFSTIVGLAGTVTHFAANFDDSTVLVPFPGGFTFAHYGVAKVSANLCVNGFINFGTATGNFSNHHAEDPALPNDAIYPWYDDLHTGATGSLVSRFDVVAGTWTVEWNGVRNFPSTSTATFSIQAVLYASTHGSLPDRIDFRYNRTSGPSLPACFDTLTLTPSATVGSEPATATTTPSAGGVDATERGAGNARFPVCDLRLVPVRATTTQYSAALNAVQQERFCTIRGLAGTVFVPNSCVAAQACTDNDNSVAMQAGAIALPWKFNLDGRIMANANMNSNGVLSLGAGNFAANSGNVALPALAQQNATLAPFWDDLEGTGPGSGMYYRVDGAPGCRVMTFEWADMDRKVGVTGDCVGAGGRVSFQVKLFEGSAGVMVQSTGACPYDGVRPGIGNDRIEYHYDHANYVAAPTPFFTATIGFEDHTGGVGGSCPGSPNIAVLPTDPAGLPAKIVIVACETGKVRYYGDRNSAVPGGCPPEIKANNIQPNIGNPFGLEIVGGAAGGIGLVILDFGGSLPGLKTPVPCGGIPTPFGTLWVNPFNFITILVCPLGGIGGGGCRGCCDVGLPIPNNNGLIGGILYAQALSVTFGGAIDFSEGMKIIIGG